VILDAYHPFDLELLAHNRGDFARLLMADRNHERRFARPQRLAPKPKIYTPRITLYAEYAVHGFLLQGRRDNQIAPKVITEVAKLGFDLMEIPLPEPAEFNSALIGKPLSENGLEASLRLVQRICIPLPIQNERWSS
jgi:hypothetical protein